MNTFETILPLFPGFYNTDFEPYCENIIYDINYERKDTGLPEIKDSSKFKFDFEAYNESVAKVCVAEVNYWLKEFDIKYTYKYIESPREYNFTNDKIVCDVEIQNWNLILEYIQANEDVYTAFTNHIVKLFKSRDGFISYYSSYPKDYLVYLEEYEETCIPIWAMISFILEWEGYTSDDLYDRVSGNVYLECTNEDDLLIAFICPICEEWYSHSDHKKKYQAQLEKDLEQMKKYGIESSTILPYEKWIKSNPLACCEGE